MALINIDMWPLMIAVVLIAPGVFLFLKHIENPKAVIIKGGLTFAILLFSLYLGYGWDSSYCPLYPYFISAGLLFGLLGDVAIEKSFKNGVIMFLIGHLCYIAAFVYLAGISAIVAVVFVVLLVVMVVAYKVIKPDFKELLIPIAIYTMVISAMFSLAVALPFTASSGSQTTRGIIIAVGAILFTASDFLLALNTFVKKSTPVDIVCIYIYFAGQFLLTASLYRGF